MPEAEQEHPGQPQRKIRIERPKNAAASRKLTRSPIMQSPPPQRSTPFLRKLLWIILAAWLVYLGFMVLDPLPFLFPDEESSEWWHIDEARPEGQPESSTP